MRQVNKILVCKTKRESNGIIGSGYRSWDTGELTIVQEVDQLVDAENIEGINNYICIPVIKFEE